MIASGIPGVGQGMVGLFASLVARNPRTDVVLSLFWLVPGAIGVLVGLLVLRFSEPIADRVLKVAELDSDIGPRIMPLQEVAFSAIGLWFSVEALLRAVYPLLQLFAKMGPFNWARDVAAVGIPLITAEEAAQLVSAVLQFAIGLWLLFKSRNLANFLARRRDGQIDAPPERSTLKVEGDQ